MGGIEEANPRERRRSRIVHWSGAGIFLSILLAALAGLVGKGPLSKMTAIGPDGSLRVEHQGFVRHHAPAELKIEIDERETASGVVHLQLSKSFIEKSEMKSIAPQPERSYSGPKFFTYDIRVQTNSSATLRILFQPDHFGSHSFIVKINDAAPLELKHFAYP
jgi:hypothetical protein